jgi:uncharacterized protein (DUF2249 family)
MRNDTDGRDWPTDGTVERLPRLDVRPTLAEGVDPFEQIIGFVDTLEAPGDGTVPAFVLVAPFDPKPLRRLFASRGYEALPRQLGPAHWQVLFRSAVPGDRRCWRADDGLHVDVRGLPAPEPLRAVLEAIGRAGAGEEVVVHHDRDPLMLFDELLERGWTAEYVDGEPGEVRLRLSREGAPRR